MLFVLLQGCGSDSSNTDSNGTNYSSDESSSDGMSSSSVSSCPTFSIPEGYTKLKVDTGVNDGKDVNLYGFYGEDVVFANMAITGKWRIYTEAMCKDPINEGCGSSEYYYFYDSGNGELLSSYGSTPFTYGINSAINLNYHDHPGLNYITSILAYAYKENCLYVIKATAADLYCQGEETYFFCKEE